MLNKSTALKKCVGMAAIIIPAVGLWSASANSQMTCAVQMQITKGGFVIGGSGGGGTVTCGGKTRRFRVSGFQFGLVIGLSTLDLVGEARNVRDVRDIEGTYTGLGASAALGGGAGNKVARNANGVELRLRGTQAGIDASLSLGGLTIRLR